MKIDKTGNTLGLIVTLVLALFIFILILAFTSPQIFGLSKDITNQQNVIYADPDGDGVKGIADSCPCTKGEIENDGCPSGFTDEQIKEDKQKFNKNKQCQ